MIGVELVTQSMDRAIYDRVGVGGEAMQILATTRCQHCTASVPHEWVTAKTKVRVTAMAEYAVQSSEYMSGVCAGCWYLATMTVADWANRAFAAG